MKKKLYCAYCGHTLGLEEIEGRIRQVCPSCREVVYENPIPAASVIVMNELKEILLVKREREPAQGMWCLPIGFAETGETIEEAALRELKEEAGIEGKVVSLIDVVSEYNEIYGDVLVVTFEVEKTGGAEKAGDDATEWGYFHYLSLPEIAFESQRRAIKKLLLLKGLTESYGHGKRGR
ncbi:MAG: NUDIX domain-containing protein [Syntrophorhabdaceae bacterium]|nr:NUDIX domain-containing protein [Syntrophorhabdaceae bacterium]